MEMVKRSLIGPCKEYMGLQGEDLKTFSDGGLQEAHAEGQGGPHRGVRQAGIRGDGRREVR